METFTPSQKLLTELEYLLRNYPPAEMSAIIRNCFMEQGYYLCAEGVGFTAGHKAEEKFLKAV